ncbi:Aldehyde/histidinol dehydrogenase [Baffinella frigidus]|nr:Aldehyde/histidinol dehydrogenase [Cryptophyta sp. CCMP2293]
MTSAGDRVPGALGNLKGYVLWWRPCPKLRVLATANENQGAQVDGKRLFVSKTDPAYLARPNIDGGKFFCNGEIREWTGAMQPVYAPIFLEGTEDKVEIGRQARLTPKEALEALEAARAAWDHGKGEWPLTPFQGRIAAMEKYVKILKTKREVIVNVLMWEICKVRADAEKEFDRTIDYINATLKAAKECRNKESTLQDVSGVLAQVRRNPIGVMLNLGPFNYPFNETYTTLIPAILMGNTVVMKLPNVGCLAHIPTMEVFAECFPKGTVNFISGAGRETMPPIMATGHVDIFAFIGGSKAADALIKELPNPHKVKICLSLDAKNLAVVLADADLDLAVNECSVDAKNLTDLDLDVAVDECVLGSLSYNGQRCTAIKLILVHGSILEAFTAKFTAKMATLKAQP